jgi:ABC-type phosphate transport system ATPase subunit
VSAPAMVTERRMPERGRIRLEAQGLAAYFGDSSAIRSVSIGLHDREVTAVIGP